MGGPCIDVQLSGNAGSSEREVHEHTVLRRADDVVPAMHKEYRRGSLWNAQAGSQFIFVLGLEIPGIDRNREVGSATAFVHLIIPGSCFT